MKSILITVLLLTLYTAAPAQTPIAQPSADQKANLATLAKTWEKESREAESARDKYLIALLAIEAELGLKPSETNVKFDAKGEPVFERAVTAKAANAKPDTPAKP